MNRSLQILAFADDVDIIARNKKVLIETYNKLDTEGNKLGLKVNKDKTKYMKVDRMKSQTTTTLTINNELQFNEVTEFKYLGSMITCDNMVEAEIKTRLAAGNRGYFLFETF